MHDLTRLFKAMSDPNRLRILKMLEVKPLCVCEITAVLGLAASTTSKHLTLLKEAGLIFEQKENKWVNYHLNSVSQIPYVFNLLPTLRQWLNDENLIRKDREKVVVVDRTELCKR